MKGQGQKLALCFLASDLIVACFSWILAYWVRFCTPIIPPAPHGIPPIDWCLRGLPLILLLATVSCRIAGLYDLNRLRSLARELPGIVRANCMLVLFWTAMLFYRSDPYKSRLVIAIFLACNLASMVIARRIAWALVHWLRGRGFNSSPALIVGTGRTAQTVQDLPVLGGIDDLDRVIIETRAAYVFVALPLSRYFAIDRVIEKLSDVPVDVRLVPDVPNLAAMSLGTSELGGLPIVSIRVSPHEGLYRVVKRAMDLAIAAAALVLLSPLMLLIALLVRFSGSGPVFYRQVRASLAGTRFEMLKFRTMRVDAESQTGPVWTSESDSRRTWLGCLLRRTSLDELPQLINVIRGEMSIVGPRPERPVFIERFRHSVPHYMLRHSVKAGITGWAQVHGWRGNTSLRKRVQYDLHYITHWTPWLDLRIMFLTVVRGMLGENAY
jgi:lipopolysaccharide/colanic/teichoic acid biosynthesis glycosyltransferase